MRVDDLRQERNGQWTEVSARFSWEDHDRPDQRIWFRLADSLADDIECNPNAFLLAAAIPAAKYGERRLLIEGKIDPVLHDGVLTALTQLREWYDAARMTPRIEPTQGFETRLPLTPGRTGQFFSGGVDALTTLRRNRMMYPVDHPGSIRDGLYVFGFHGFDFQNGEPCPKRLEAWNRAYGQMRGVALEERIELHRLQTNAFSLSDDIQFGDQEYHSAVLFCFGHLLLKRFSDLHIASSDYLGDSEPWGSHPLLDIYYGGSGLRCHHDGWRLRRLEKVQLIADWPTALGTLNVCFRNVPSETHINCGTCPKCLRTMTELLIAGHLHENRTFPSRDLKPELIRAVHLDRTIQSHYWEECLEPLRAMGRLDLVKAVEELLVDAHARQRRRHGYGLKPKIKKLDNALLGGWLQKTWLSRKRAKAEARCSDG